MAFSFRYGHFDSPMRFSFKHASAERSETQNVIVSLSDDKGQTGYGEGCPREYVTGETSQSTFSFLEKHGHEISEVSTKLETFRGWIEKNKYLIDKNPSAFCAIELAVLDLLGQRKNLELEPLLGLPLLKEPVTYTAVLGDSSPKKTLAISLAYQLYGFSDFKAKLSGNHVRDQKRFAKLPKSATLRVDANNLWTDADTCIAYCKRLNRPFWAIEEPVQAFNVDAMHEIANELNTKIILDESCLNKEHIFLYSQYAGQFIANIRVSKCGGILRSIDLAKHCSTFGIDVILGAHVGETSLLTRAALAVGQSMQNRPLAREGAYGKILLKQDISEPSVMVWQKRNLAAR
ncbi:MAG: hypothetical protein COA78_13575 [Blastopirellula sp.]|nr:MAG: hypothetical protein COA78_13575 [Blastopirellula sp.]